MTSLKGKEGSKKITIIVIIIVISLAVVIGKLIVSNVFDTSDINIESQLLKMTNETNKKISFNGGF